MRLSEKDYDDILKFYKIKSRKRLSKKDKQKKATNILSDKLCKCIKSIQKTRKFRSENQIIPICKNSVLRKKGFQAKKFTCKAKKTILLSKLKTRKMRNARKMKTKTKKTRSKKTSKSRK